MTRTTSPDRAAVIDGIVAEVGPALKQLRAAALQRILQCGASMTHLHVLLFIDDSVGVPMSRIADHLDVSLSNASGLIDRMEERGVVERVRVADDRRVVLVRTTDRGRDLLARVDLLRTDAVRHLAERLDDVQLARLSLTIADLTSAATAELQTQPANITGRRSRGAP